MVIEKSYDLCLRPLERNNLCFIHELNDDAKIMRYWSEGPYETFTELSQFCDHHVHNQCERRFICEDDVDEAIGLVELIGLNCIHRHGEFQIIVAPDQQSHGYASTVTRLVVDYTFMVLNLHKLYLVVDVVNERVIHVYEKCGFQREDELIEGLFSNGAYYSALCICMSQRDYVKSIRGIDRHAAVGPYVVRSHACSSCCPTSVMLSTRECFRRAGQPGTM